MSRKTRIQQIMNEYYHKLGQGPHHYDNAAVAAAIVAVAAVAVAAVAVAAVDK